MGTERRAKGLYWDRAWKLVEGCTKVSAGCDNCWSETETAMRAFHPNEKISRRAADLIEEHPDCDRLFFNGEVLLREDNLDLPLRVKKPTVFAVWNDLFHEDVTDEFRDRAYAVMALTLHHTFLVLTKRAQRMAAYFADEFRWAMIEGDAQAIYAKRTGEDPSMWLAVHDIPNCWNGITAENQQTAAERIPHLLRVPGRRFLSIEPMLGRINFVDGRVPYLPAHDENSCGHHDAPWDEYIDAVLLGGESGKNARSMDPDWARSVRDQCAAAGIPFFFKQWGEWLPFSQREAGQFANSVSYQDNGWAWRVGRRIAGRRLDGRTHDKLPWGLM